MTQLFVVSIFALFSMNISQVHHIKIIDLFYRPTLIYEIDHDFLHTNGVLHTNDVIKSNHLFYLPGLSFLSSSCGRPCFREWRDVESFGKFPTRRKVSRS